MAVYLVTGKLGSGKSLCTVGKIRDYLNQGRMVATNLDIKMEKLVNPWAKNTRVFRLPDKPTVDDLSALPRPYEGKYNEDKMGLIVLDECGTWFNTRNFNDKARKPLIDKLLHIRKLGWDVMFIIQHIEMMDKQVREGLGELIVHCSRTDRLAVPIFGLIARIFGFEGRPPKMHMALVKYGTGLHAPVNDRWFYRGADLYDAYDTEQVFGANDCAIHSVLPPNTVYGRYITRKQHAANQLRQSRRAVLNFFIKAKRLFFCVGLAIGFAASAAITGEPETIKNETKVKPATAELSTDETPTELASHPLDGVWITASVKYSDGFDYTFYRDENTVFYPEYHGYKVHWKDTCAARLIGDNEVHVVTCEAKRVGLPREGVTPQSTAQLASTHSYGLPQ
jgi:hypothetical protein